jgi:hypothetical protein
MHMALGVYKIIPLRAQRLDQPDNALAIGGREETMRKPAHEVGFFMRLVFGLGVSSSRVQISNFHGHLLARGSIDDGAA